MTFTLIVATIGYGVAFHWGLPVVSSEEKSLEWPVFTGTVNQSRVTSSIADSGEATYVAEISYRYEMHGEKYIGNAVSLGDAGPSADRDVAAALSGRYPIGRSVEVFVEPRAPNRTVLEPGASSRGYLIFAGGMSATALAAIIFVMQLNGLARHGAARVHRHRSKAAAGPRRPLSKRSSRHDDILETSGVSGDERVWDIC